LAAKKPRKKRLGTIEPNEVAVLCQLARLPCWPKEYVVGRLSLRSPPVPFDRDCPAWLSTWRVGLDLALPNRSISFLSAMAEIAAATLSLKLGRLPRGPVGATQHGASKGAPPPPTATPLVYESDALSGRWEFWCRDSTDQEETTRSSEEHIEFPPVIF
jgi:hypothetical protein